MLYYNHIIHSIKLSVLFFIVGLCVQHSIDSLLTGDSLMIENQRGILERLIHSQYSVEIVQHLVKHMTGDTRHSVLLSCLCCRHLLALVHEQPFLAKVHLFYLCKGHRLFRCVLCTFDPLAAALGPLLSTQYASCRNLHGILPASMSWICNSLCVNTLCKDALLSV